jgi:hypothetical protein
MANEWADVCACGEQYRPWGDTGTCWNCKDGVCYNCAVSSFPDDRESEHDELYVCKACQRDGLDPNMCRVLLYELFGKASRIRQMMNKFDIPVPEGPMSYKVWYTITGSRVYTRRRIMHGLGWGRAGGRCVILHKEAKERLERSSKKRKLSKNNL